MKILSIFVLMSILNIPVVEKKIRVLITCSGCEGFAPSAESVKGFQKYCKEVTVTINREKADYIVVSDYTGAGLLRNPRKVAVFNSQGDAIYGGDAKTLKGVVKAACKVIREDIATVKEQ